MHIWKRKSFLILIVCLIIALNCITFFLLFENAKNSDRYFGYPSQIIVYNSKGRIQLNRRMDEFLEIITLNEKRVDYLEYYFEVEPVSLEEEPLYIQYKFQIAPKLTFEFQYQNETIKVKSIYFLLKGEHNGKILLETNEGYRVFGKLPVSSELNTFASQLKIRD